MTKFGVAQSVRRVEDPRLLKGGGRYTDDIVLPGMLHGVVVRSPHAAARINRVDTAAAKALPGVHGVYTAGDLQADGLGPLPCVAPVDNRDGSKMHDKPRPALAGDAVRHVGDPVAFVVADTAEAARDAAELVAVDYDALPSITDLSVATETGAALVWPDVANNTAFDWSIGDKAATDAEFAKATHVTRLTVVNNRIVVSSMEARACIADYDAATKRWALYANTQGGWLVKDLIAAVFNADKERFRVVTPDVGGGFGMKLFLYPEHVLTCYAAQKLGRPVKWASGRSEAFLCDTQGRDNITLGELAIDADGKLLALRTLNLANMGAYLNTFAPAIPTGAGTGVLASVYGFKAVYANVLGVFTNTVPVDAYRGAGRPESNYLVERLIDAAARELGIDGVEFRKRNMVLPSAMPHSTPVGKTTTAAISIACWARRSRRWTMPGSPRAVPRQCARQAAWLRAGVLPGSHRRRSDRAGGNPFRRRRICRCLCGHAIDRPGARDGLRATDRRAIGSRRREDPHPPGRHRYHSRWAGAPAARAACIPRARRSC